MEIEVITDPEVARARRRSLKLNTVRGWGDSMRLVLKTDPEYENLQGRPKLRIGYMHGGIYIRETVREQVVREIKEDRLKPEVLNGFVVDTIRAQFPADPFCTGNENFDPLDWVRGGVVDPWRSDAKIKVFSKPYGLANHPLEEQMAFFTNLLRRMCFSNPEGLGGILAMVNNLPWGKILQVEQLQSLADAHLRALNLPTLPIKITRPKIRENDESVKDFEETIASRSYKEVVKASYEAYWNAIYRSKFSRTNEARDIGELVQRLYAPYRWTNFPWIEVDMATRWYVMEDILTDEYHRENPFLSFVMMHQGGLDILGPQQRNLTLAEILTRQNIRTGLGLSTMATEFVVNAPGPKFRIRISKPESRLKRDTSGYPAIPEEVLKYWESIEGRSIYSVFNEKYDKPFDQALSIIHHKWAEIPPSQHDLDTFRKAVFYLPPVGGKIPLVIDGKSPVGLLKPTLSVEQQSRNLLDLREAKKLGRAYVHQISVQGRLPDRFKYCALALILDSPYANNWSIPFYKAPWGEIAPLVHDGGNFDLRLNPLWEGIEGRTDFLQRVDLVFESNLERFAQLQREKINELPYDQAIRVRIEELERKRIALELKAYQRLALALHSQQGTAPYAIPRGMRSQLALSWDNFERKIDLLLREYNIHLVAEVSWILNSARKVKGFAQPRLEADWPPIQDALTQLEEVRQQYPELRHEVAVLLRNASERIDEIIGLKKLT